MFSFFKKKKEDHILNEKIKELNEWIIPRKIWDDVYNKLLMIQKNKRALVGYYYPIDDFKYRCKPEEITEELYVKNIENLLIIIGDGKISELKTVTTYRWEKRLKEFSAKDTDEGIAFKELDNGDLLIEYYSSKNKKDTYISTSYKERIRCGDWEKKMESYWLRIDATIDENYRNAMKKAEILLKDYRECKVLDPKIDENQ